MLRVSMFGFPNHRLFVSPRNICLAVTPASLTSHPSRGRDQTPSQCTHREAHYMCAQLGSHRHSSDFWVSGAANTHFVLCKQGMHTPRSLPPGMGCVWEHIPHRGKVSMEPAGAAGCSALLKSRTFIFRLLNELRSLNLGSYF